MAQQVEYLGHIVVPTPYPVEGRPIDITGAMPLLLVLIVVLFKVLK